MVGLCVNPKMQTRLNLEPFILYAPNHNTTNKQSCHREQTWTTRSPASGREVAISQSPHQNHITDHADNKPHGVTSLKSQIRLQASTLLTAESSRQLITSSTTATADSTTTAANLQARLQAQQAHNQQCLYRACASITTFRVRDPDPNAVDAGNVLGVRIEVMTRARFLRPYFVLLNRPYSSSSEKKRSLRVHRHTVPACVPLPGLAARHLPAPGGDGDGMKERKQDLPRFVRCLRREIVRYHNRVAVIADLRKAVGLDGKSRVSREAGEKSPLLNISAADTEAKQVKVDWKDGRAGRLVIGDDGDVVKLVVFGERGRDRELTRELLKDGNRLEDVARRLGEV